MPHIVTCDNHTFAPILAFDKEEAERIASFIVSSWNSEYPVSNDVPKPSIEEAPAPVEAWEFINKHIKWHIDNEVAIAKRKVINEIHR